MPRSEPARAARLGLSQAIRAAAAKKAELRHAIRVSIAVGVTFAISILLRLPQGYWAVFTAVIVVQASIGGTIAASRDRLIGTVVGAFVGAGAVYLKGTTALDQGLVLCAVVAVLAFAAAVRPSLKVAPITAVIVIIAGPHDVGPLHAALMRTAEITIGGVVGVCATLFIFPARAHDAAVDHLAKTMRQVADLLALHREQLNGVDVADSIQSTQVAIRTSLAAVEAAMSEAVHETASRLSDRDVPEAVPRTLWRIRGDVVTIGRALDARLPPTVLEHLRPAVSDLLAAQSDRLRACAAAIRNRTVLDKAQAMAVAHSGFQEAVETMRVQGLTDVLGFDVASRVFGLVFAQENLFANIGDLSDRVTEMAAGRT